MQDLVEGALEFAERVHAGLVRLGSVREPCVVHLIETASLVEESGGSDEEIAAALLHDSVEDTSVTIDDIVEHFGVVVATIVDGMTDPLEFSSLPLLVRKRLQAERVRSKSESVKRVKVADQTSNLRSVTVDPPTRWGRQKCLDYIGGARLIAEECRGVSAFLDIQFEEAYQAAIKARQ